MVRTSKSGIVTWLLAFFVLTALAQQDLISQPSSSRSALPEPGLFLFGQVVGLKEEPSPESDWSLTLRLGEQTATLDPTWIEFGPSRYYRVRIPFERVALNTSTTPIRLRKSGRAFSLPDQDSNKLLMTITSPDSGAVFGFIDNGGNINETQTIPVTERMRARVIRADVAPRDPSTIEMRLANWLLEHFEQQDISLNSDADGDGSIDLDEFIAGTDPNDSKSLLAIHRIAITENGQIELQWRSILGKRYQIERRIGTNGERVILKESIGTGDTTTFLDTTPPNSHETIIYQVTIAP